LESSKKVVLPFFALTQSVKPETASLARRALRLLLLLDVACAKARLKDGISGLLALVRSGEDDIKSSALRMLKELSANESNRELFVEADGLSTMLAVLHDGDEADRAHAASLKDLVAFGDRALSILANPGVITVMVALATQGSNNLKTKAARALRDLATKEANRAAIAAEGGIPPLLALLHRSHDCHTVAAASALKYLAVDRTCQAEIAANGGIGALTAMVLKPPRVFTCPTIRALGLVLAGLPKRKKREREAAVVSLIQLSRKKNPQLTSDIVSVLEHLSTIRKYQDVIGDADADDPLSCVIRTGTESQKIGAIRTLQNMALFKKSLVAEFNVVPPIVDLLRQRADSIKTEALNLLRVLSGPESLTTQLVKCKGVAVLASLALGPNEIHKVEAQSTLLSVASFSEGIKELFQVGAVDQLANEEISGDAGQRKFAAAVLSSFQRDCELGPRVRDVQRLYKSVLLAQQGNPTQTLDAARELRYLASTAEGQAEIIRRKGILRILVEMVSCEDDAIATHATDVLRVLVKTAANKERIPEAGGIPPLIDLLRVKNCAMRTPAAQAVRLLAESTSIAESIIEAEGVSAIAAVLENGEGDQREEAIGTI